MTSQNNDDIVISGLSCRLPKSKNVKEFKENLLNGVDMVTDDGTRWRPGLHGLPRAHGRIDDLDKFDASFFNISPKQANCIDPQLRMLLEISYEAIVDAGVDPTALRGKNVGVYTAVSSSEFFNNSIKVPDVTDGYALTGSSRTMFANRISFCYDFKGPSNTFDTACSGGLSALYYAVQNILAGQCDMALVCGSNICISAVAQVQFLNAGLLSPDGRCKTFDASGNGYVRSEGIVALFLQRSKDDLRRAYCSIPSIGTNCDGYKKQGISHPSSELQEKILTKVYNDAGVNPSDVSYVEAHGTGTAVGDPIEANVIADFFCKQRSGPLKIGSVKSNLGHGESVSGLTSIVKCIVAMETETIPGNLHLVTPNPDIKGITDGRLKVITENTPWQPGLVGVNSFGFGGSNVHAILKPWHKKQNKNSNIQSTEKRLVVACARTKAGLENMLNFATKSSEEFQCLMSEAVSSCPANTAYKGYTILNDTNRQLVIQKKKTENRPVWFVFAGMGSQWPGMGKKMMELETFRESILRSENVLKQFNFELVDILTNGTEETFSSVLNTFVSIVAIQIGLVDVLSSMKIHPDGMLGHSVGELVCGYVDGCQTAEQTILLAYWRGYYIQEAKLPAGAMAAVGLTWTECGNRCPPGVVPACHNSQDMVTVSGPAEAVRYFVQRLNTSQVYAKEIASSGIAFHSYFMKKAEIKILEEFKKIIKSPKPRSNRWKSSSVPLEKWSTPLAKICSAEYHVNNVTSPVLFYEALQHIPKEAIVIEIAPTSLLQASIKRTVSVDCFVVGLMKAYHSDPVHHCLTQIGECYNQGLSLNACGVISKNSFPVPRGTPALSPLIEWDHSETWDDGFDSANKDDRADFDIDISPGADYEFIRGHVFDGRILFPAAGYLILVWRAWAQIHDQQPEETIISMRDIKLYNAVVVPESGRTTLTVRIFRGSMRFEITNGDVFVADGILVDPDREGPSFDDMLYERYDDNDILYHLKSEDVYKEIRLLGQEFQGAFKKIQGLAIAPTVTWGKIKWDDIWISFVDNMLQTMLFPNAVYKNKFIPQNIDYFYINPEETLKKIVNGELVVQFKEWSTYVRAGGIVIFHHKSRTMPRKPSSQRAVLQKYQFTPYGVIPDMPNVQSIDEYVKKCSDLALCCLGKMIASKHEYANVFKEVIANACGTSTAHISESEVQQLSENKEHSLCNILAMMLKEQNNTSMAMYPLIELRHDIAYSYLSKSDFISMCIDTVCENMDSAELTIAELKYPKLKDFIVDKLSTKQELRYTYKTALTDVKSLINSSDEMHWPLDNGHGVLSKKTYLLVADNVFHSEPNITEALSNISHGLIDGGFVLIRETTKNYHLQQPYDIIEMNLRPITDPNNRTCAMYCNEEKWRKHFAEAGFEVVMQQSDPYISTIFLLRKTRTSGIDKQWMVDVTAPNYAWIEKLKADLSRLQSRPGEEHLWLVARDNINGVVGMVNCLRMEPGGDRLRCILLAEKQPIGPKVVEMIQKLARTDMVINVQHTDGTWGCYRHLPLDKEVTHNVDYAFLNSMIRGDLSSLSWIESQLKYRSLKTGFDICRVNYSSLNFRDVMLVSGKLDPVVIPGDLPQDCPIGMEFTGRASDGTRIMGLVSNKGIATAVEYNKNYAWKIPDHWSMSEACTVPVAYTTAYYALVCRGNIKKGEKVLIHAGSGGVGQAAIAIALSYDCEVYTTVSNETKKNYLLSRFPKLKPEHFFSSRDVSFEPGVERASNYEGCDIILNSLSDNMLLSSIRLLKTNGRFLEIGKYDMMKNTPIGMNIFIKNVSFHGILTDKLFEVDGKPNAEWSIVHKWLPEGIKSGVVRPLDTTIFDKHDQEAAFRFMAQGKHIGKILIKILPEDASSYDSITAIPRFYCSPTKRYIVHGGLGGFGLEFCKWLTERGARYITVTSRSGIKNGYQQRMIHHMKEDGIDFIVSKLDMSKLDDVKKLITSSEQPIGGIFNLAMVLEDALLNNQNQKTFQNVCKPKVDATKNLDQISRELCKESCDWFVCFSSASSGFGNKGQSNYGFANSSMERICECRKADGLHGLAIQWGAIGDVGVVYETFGGNDASIGGTAPQLLPSCFAALDTFLTQDNTVVSSHVPVDMSQTVEGSTKGDDLTKIVNRILGITEHHTVKDDVVLGDIGLDSLMAVEIQQAFERLLDISIHTNAIRQLTLHDIKTISQGAVPEDMSKNKFKVLEDYIRIEDSFAPTELILPLNNVYDKSKTPLYIIHTLEGVIGRMSIIAEQMEYPVYGVQCTAEVPLEDIEAMSKYYIDAISKHNKNGKFNLCGFSYGSCVAVAMALLMDKLGTRNQLGKIVLMDGSHKTIKTQAEYNRRRLAHTGMTPEVLAFNFFTHLFAISEAKAVVDRFLLVDSWDEKVDIVYDTVSVVYPDLPVEDLKFAISRFVRRLYITLLFNPDTEVQKDIMLVKMDKELVQSGLLPADYGLSEVFKGEVKIHSVQGNHLDFYEKESKINIARAINDYLDETEE